MQLIKHRGNRLISYFPILQTRFIGQNQMYNFIKDRRVQQTAYKMIFCFLLCIQICKLVFLWYYSTTVKAHLTTIIETARGLLPSIKLNRLWPLGSLTHFHKSLHGLIYWRTLRRVTRRSVNLLSWWWHHVFRPQSIRLLWSLADHCW